MATTTKWDWLQRLGDSWPLVRSLLVSTGRLATEIACPAPGGEGCPRKIVRVGERYRAVCGNNPAQCESIDVMTEEIAHLGLDRKKLGREICKILNAAPSEDNGVLIGNYPVVAGQSIPIVLAIPGPDEGLPQLPVSSPAVVLVPTDASLSRPDRVELQLRKYTAWPLSQIVGSQDGNLACLVSPDLLFAELRDQIIEANQPTGKGIVWSLPASATWEKMTFELISDERLNVRYETQTKSFEPADLGLNDRRTGRAAAAWALLGLLARGNGRLSRPQASEKRQRLEKQKQLLGKRLAQSFGLPGNPIMWDKRQHLYVTRFVIRDGRPKNARDREAC